MKRLAVTSFALCMSLLGTNAAAQVLSQTQPPPYSDYTYHLPGLDDRTPSTPRLRRSPPKDGPAPEPRVLEKGPLAPSSVDRETYASFLSQPNTGLIRL